MESRLDAQDCDQYAELTYLVLEATSKCHLAGKDILFELCLFVRDGNLEVLPTYGRYLGSSMTHPHLAMPPFVLNESRTANIVHTT